MAYRKPQSKKTVIIILIIAFILAALGVGGAVYYASLTEVVPIDSFADDSKPYCTFYAVSQDTSCDTSGLIRNSYYSHHVNQSCDAVSDPPVAETVFQCNFTGRASGVDSCDSCSGDRVLKYEDGNCFCCQEITPKLCPVATDQTYCANLEVVDSDGKVLSTDNLSSEISVGINGSLYEGIEGSDSSDSHQYSDLSLKFAEKEITYTQTTENNYKKISTEPFIVKEKTGGNSTAEVQFSGKVTTNNDKTENFSCVKIYSIKQPAELNFGSIVADSIEYDMSESNDVIYIRSLEVEYSNFDTSNSDQDITVNLSSPEADDDYSLRKKFSEYSDTGAAEGHLLVKKLGENIFRIDASEVEGNSMTVSIGGNVVFNGETYLLNTISIDIPLDREDPPEEETVTCSFRSIEDWTHNEEAGTITARKFNFTLGNLDKITNNSAVIFLFKKPSDTGFNEEVPIEEPADNLSQNYTLNYDMTWSDERAETEPYSVGARLSVDGTEISCGSASISLDEPTPPPTTPANLSVSKTGTSCVERVSPNNMARFTIYVHNGSTASEPVRDVVDKLPLGFDYVSGSASISINGINLGTIDPDVTQVGSTDHLVWRPETGDWSIEGGSRLTITFSARATGDALTGVALNEVVITPANDPTDDSVRTQYSFEVAQRCTSPETGIFDSVASRIVIGLVVILLGIIFYYSVSDRSVLKILSSNKIGTAILDISSELDYIQSKYTSPKEYFEEKISRKIDKERRKKR